MATYTGFTAGSVTGHASEGRVPYLVEAVVDFSKRNAAAGDIFEMIAVPAETLVLEAGLEVLSTISSAGSPTFDVDINGSANFFVAAHSTLTAGYSSQVDHANPGILVTAKNTIDLTVNTSTATAGKIRVWALMVDVSGVTEAANVANADDTTSVTA